MARILAHNPNIEQCNTHIQTKVKIFFFCFSPKWMPPSLSLSFKIFSIWNGRILLLQISKDQKLLVICTVSYDSFHEIQLRCFTDGQTGRKKHICQQRWGRGDISTITSQLLRVNSVVLMYMQIALFWSEILFLKSRISQIAFFKWNKLDIFTMLFIVIFSLVYCKDARCLWIQRLYIIEEQFCIVSASGF